MTWLCLDCGYTRKYDVVFVIDESGSVDSSEFTSELTFYQSLSTALYVGQNQANIAAITISDAVRERFGLTSHLTSQTVSNAIGALVANGGGSLYTAGLEYAFDNILTPHGRQNSHKFIIISVDHTNDIDSQTYQVSDQIKAAGVAIFTIGVGSGVDLNALSAVSSGSQYALSVTSWTTISTLYTSIVDVLCPYCKSHVRI